MSLAETIKVGLDNSDGDYFKISDGTALGTNDRLVIDTSGNVGIGTQTPTSILHTYQDNTDVASSATLGLTIEQDGTGDAVMYYLLTGVRRWTVGIDNSDADKYKISKDNFTTAPFQVDVNNNIIMPNLPTSDPTIAGALWNDSGTLKVSAG